MAREESSDLEALLHKYEGREELLFASSMYDRILEEAPRAVEKVGIVDRTAQAAVNFLRWNLDHLTRWKQGDPTQRKTMLRAILTAVPSFVASIFERETPRDDKLLTFIVMYDPGLLFRWAVIAGQVALAGVLGTAYAVNPAYCHCIAGYVEEDARETYSEIIDTIENAPDDTDLAAWRTTLAPPIARAYWRLGDTGTVLDLMKAVRADEPRQPSVPGRVTNPFEDPKIDEILLRYVTELLSLGRADGDTLAPPKRSPHG
ncbi:hypothetical protein CTAYLR_001095 [Chrysophaeum taylorii]|uniref:Uncharacterized protein n=1 Tax=Chrysophaeum taylorii TaxID=2483200 RepID=A0AAD7UQK5_9STRA|nr:hypothetical protein CTAYLR_001095 [Chrysophaeum taylorii]